MKPPGRIGVGFGAMARAAASDRGWAGLLAVCRTLTFEPHDPGAFLNSGGRYELPLDEEFPFAIRLLHYSSRWGLFASTWHERLELFIPIDGRTLFQMGEELIDLQASDCLVVDNLKLHHVADFEGFDSRAVVVSFRPEFVYSLGSLSHDYVFLLPFYPPPDRRPRVLPLRSHAEAADALRRLVVAWTGAEPGPLRRAECRVALLELLLELARRFRTPEPVQWEFLRQQKRSLRLKPLFDHISQHYAEKLTVAEAAAIAGMSEPQFMKTFKRVAGLTLIGYLNHVRLAAGVRLLRETSLSIAEVASAVGFTDQSYFDKRFKRAFGSTPRDFRAGRSESP
jgi:AraC-like DNA-binding protein